MTVYKTADEIRAERAAAEKRKVEADKRNRDIDAAWEAHAAHEDRQAKRVKPARKRGGPLTTKALAAVRNLPASRPATAAPAKSATQFWDGAKWRKVK